MQLSIVEVSGENAKCWYIFQNDVKSSKQLYIIKLVIILMYFLSWYYAWHVDESIPAQEIVRTLIRRRSEPSVQKILSPVTTLSLKQQKSIERKTWLILCSDV